MTAANSELKHRIVISYGESTANSFVVEWREI